MSTAGVVGVEQRLDVLDRGVLLRGFGRDEGRLALRGRQRGRFGADGAREVATSPAARSCKTVYAELDLVVGMDLRHVGVLEHPKHKNSVDLDGNNKLIWQAPSS